jgi:hypothetical protein
MVEETDTEIPYRPRRGLARQDKQLSKLQREILVWIYDKGGNSKLILWSAKLFSAETNLESDRFTVSRSLKSLEDKKRELLFKTGFQPNIQVKLLSKGIEVAKYEIKYGMTPRQYANKVFFEFSVPEFYEEIEQLKRVMLEYEDFIRNLYSPDFQNLYKGHEIVKMGRVMRMLELRLKDRKNMLIPQIFDDSVLDDTDDALAELKVFIAEWKTRIDRLKPPVDLDDLPF